ncbi:hypothetical protein AHAS_Ahas11G0059400 [Arachis hypogaea]
MTVCDWNMCFIFTLPGWEDKIPDTHSRYPTPIGYISPYRYERYHLPNFGRSSGFANGNEVFKGKFKIDLQFWVVCQNFEFTQYKDENIIEDKDDNQIDDSLSPNLSVTSSSEMNIVRDSIRNQIFSTHIKSYQVNQILILLQLN